MRLCYNAKRMTLRVIPTHSVGVYEYRDAGGRAAWRYTPEKIMDETPLRRRLRLDQPANTPIDEPPTRTTWERIPSDSAEDRAPPSVRGVVKELLETAIFILLVFLIVRGVVQNFKIEGSSMQPNMHTNQYILVNKIIYFHF